MGLRLAAVGHYRKLNRPKSPSPASASVWIALVQSRRARLSSSKSTSFSIGFPAYLSCGSQQPLYILK